MKVILRKERFQQLRLLTLICISLVSVGSVGWHQKLKFGLNTVVAINCKTTKEHKHYFQLNQEGLINERRMQNHIVGLCTAQQNCASHTKGNYAKEGGMNITGCNMVHIRSFC